MRLRKLLPILLLAPAAGIAYQWIGARSDRKRLLEKNKLIHVGDGRRLYCSCTESQTGTSGPTIIFEAGIGATSQNWTWLQREVSRFARTITYDRSGLGWSSPSTSPRTLSNMVHDLRTLLQQAGLPPPYLLVGHSFGGLIVRHFAVHHPEEVSGVLLIDPMRPEQWLASTEARRAELTRGRLLSTIGVPLAHLGVARLAFNSLLRRSGRVSHLIGLATGTEGRFLFERITTEVGKMPRESWATVAAIWSTPDFYRGLAAHIEAIPESLHQIQQNPPIEKIPVLVLTAANSEPLHPDDLGRISPQAREIVIEKSTHWIHLDQPHQVLNAIQTLLEEIRSTEEKREPVPVRSPS